ncbi:MAG: hypothetical protein GX556_17185 [Fibrobacter sp.]|nr:hypothetical protein [Fibrobacter sp.]
MKFFKKLNPVIFFVTIVAGQSISPEQKEQAIQLLRNNPDLLNQYENNTDIQPKDTVTPLLPPPSTPIIYKELEPLQNSVISDTVVDRKEICGRHVFQQENISLINNHAPENYVIVEGDQVLLRLWGRINYDKTYTVGKEGQIFIEPLNKNVYIKGITQQKMREIISHLTSTMTGIEVDVRVVSTHPVKMNVFGRAKKPGTVLIPPYCTFWQALVHSMGPSDQGSIRDVRLIRNGKVLIPFDTYAFFKAGKIPDIMMQDGDQIFFGDLQNVVEIKGIVRRPGKYEVKSTETISDLIEFAGGFDSKDISPLIEVERLIPLAERDPDSPTRRILDLKAFDDECKSFTLYDGDIISEKEMLVEVENYVNISGLGINVPGRYSIKGQQSSLWDVVQKAGGFVKGHFPSIEIIRKTSDGSKSVKLLLENLNSARVFLLQNGDSVLTYHETQFKDVTTIQVFGYFRNPVNLMYSDSLSLQSVIQRAGGLGEGALPYVYIKKTDERNIIRYETVKVTDAQNYYMAKRDQVYAFDYKKFTGKLPVVVQVDDRESLVLEYSDDLNLKIIIHRLGALPPTTDRNSVEIYTHDFSKPDVHTYMRRINLTPDNISSCDLIQEGTLVIFRKDMKKEKIGLVFLVGEFANPGGYPIMYDKETLKEIILRANGFTSRANIYSLYMKKKGYSTDIPIQVVSNSPLKIKSEILLADGDSIFVGQDNNTVEITGQVFNPGIVTYVQRYSWRDYINSAGGKLKTADINKSYIVYPNGNASRTKTRRLFTQCKVVSGSKIIVPEKSVKPEREKPVFDYKEFLALASGSMTLLLTTIIVAEKIK